MFYICQTDKKLRLICILVNRKLFKGQSRKKALHQLTRRLQSSISHTKHCGSHMVKKVKVGNDQEMAQSERNSHSKNQRRKKN